MHHDLVDCALSIPGEVKTDSVEDLLTHVFGQGDVAVASQELILNQSGNPKVLERLSTKLRCLAHFKFSVSVISFQVDVDARSHSVHFALFVHKDELAGPFIVAADLHWDRLLNPRLGEDVLDRTDHWLVCRVRLLSV